MKKRYTANQLWVLDILLIGGAIEKWPNTYKYVLRLDGYPVGFCRHSTIKSLQTRGLIDEDFKLISKN